MRLFSLILGGSVFGLDLATKWWVQQTPWVHNYVLIPGFLKLQYVQNEGMAFGLLHDNEGSWKVILLSMIAVVALIVVLTYIRSTPPEHRLQLISLGLLLGGILGNFTDRLVHHYVVDFVTLHWSDWFYWPTFNLADAAISCGVGLVLYQSLFVRGDSGIP